MDYKNELGSQIIQIVENQLKTDNPSETRKTLERLIKNGYNEAEAKQLIAQCVLVEMFDVIKSQNKYNEARYISNLHRLPEEPVSFYENKSSDDIIKRRRH